MKYFAWGLLYGFIGLILGLLTNVEFIAIMLTFIGFMAPMYFLVESIYKDIHEIKQYTKFTADKMYNNSNE
ncbi:MAG: hypothetical protein RSA01_10570 [Clostridium sp.]|uniref:hypothetical protein n=1 Tax=Clostridium sp. TaxID=1506 RepID=UPI002FC64C5F